MNESEVGIMNEIKKKWWMNYDGPVYSVHMRILSNPELKPMINWLKLNVGEQDVDWIFGLDFSGGIKNACDKFSFKTAEAKVLFILRWG